MNHHPTALSDRCTQGHMLSLCLLAVAGIELLLMGFQNYMLYFYKNCLIVPCMLFLGAALMRPLTPGTKRRLLLGALMSGWFLLLQVRRSTQEDVQLYNAGLFLSTYLFAFPMASLLGEEERKKALRIFGCAYLAASSILVGYVVCLLLECVPAFMEPYVYWDGSRLYANWHPNVTACILMVGIGFCLAFLLQAKKRWSGAALLALLLLHLGALALTSSRTSTLITGGLVGGTLFFSMIRRGGWVRFLMGLMVAGVAALGIFFAAGRLYQYHSDALLEKYTAQYQQELVPAQTEAPAQIPETIPAETAAQTEAEETALPEQTEQTIPLEIDPNTGELALKTEAVQGDLRTDMKTLNGRIYMWEAAFVFLKNNPAAVLWGTDYPGRDLSEYAPFYVDHAHNAWVESLLALGVPGFALVLMFTLSGLWNAAVVLIRHHDDVWKRMTALLVLCLMAVSIMEPYLFITNVYYHFVDLLFFLCLGYLSCWQEEENRQLLAKLLRKEK